VLGLTILKTLPAFDQNSFITFAAGAPTSQMRQLWSARSRAVPFPEQALLTTEYNSPPLPREAHQCKNLRFSVPSVFSVAGAVRHLLCLQTPQIPSTNFPSLANNLLKYFSPPADKIVLRRWASLLSRRSFHSRAS